MSYHLTILFDFACPPARVYEALTDLGRYPDWTHDMTWVSHAGPMRTGLYYTTETLVLGRTNRSDIIVNKLVPERLITLQSQSGLVEFTAEYHLAEAAGSGCCLTLYVQLSFSKAVFNLARPVAQAVAEARIRGDLENLRARLQI